LLANFLISFVQLKMDMTHKSKARGTQFWREVKNTSLREDPSERFAAAADAEFLQLGLQGRAGHS